MKIAIRGGHNFLSIGARALIDEVTEDRKVKDSVIKYLKIAKHDVLDVTPGDIDYNSDLAFGVNKANSWGADLFVSIHFNKAYHSYKGALGTEAWVYSKTDKFADEQVAQRIVNEVAKLGFKNRGVKTEAFYELKNTKMPAVIFETCFVEATEDVALYKKLGHDVIGKAIAEGIVGHVINVAPPTKAVYRVRKSWADVKSQIGAFSDLGNAKKLADSKKGYTVYDSNGKAVYPVAKAPVVNTPPKPPQAPQTGEHIIKEYAEKGVFTCTVDAINFRNKPYVGSDNPIQGQYFKNETVNYDYVVITNKYVWISWISASSGVRRYMPITDKSNNEKWGYCK